MNGTITLIGTYPPPYGGVSIHIKRLNLALQRRGLKVAVLAQPDSDSDDDGVCPTRLGPSWYIHQLLRRNTGVLHFHTSGLNSRRLLLLSVLAFLGKPVVITFHSFRDEPQAHLLKFSSMPSLALRAFPHIICVGAEVRDKIVGLGVNPSRTSVISSYLPPVLNDDDRRQIHPDVDRFLNSHHPVITASAYRLVFFEGEDLYGLDLCVELCRHLIRNYPHLGFVFSLPDIGDEGYYASILQRISDYDLDNHFCFSHTLAEYWPIIERSSLFVRPTNTDSYGVSVAEAIDLGVPAIASDVCERAPGTILFRKRDFQDLLEKTRMVLDNLDEHKRRLANHRIGQTGTVDRIIAVYRSVMKA